MSTSGEMKTLEEEEDAISHMLYNILTLTY